MLKDLFLLVIFISWLEKASGYNTYTYQYQPITSESNFKQIGPDINNVDHITQCSNICGVENQKLGGFCNAFTLNEYTKTCKIGLRCNVCQHDSQGNISDIVYSDFHSPGLDLGIRAGARNHNRSIYFQDVELIKYNGEICENHGIPDIPYPEYVYHSIVTLAGKLIFLVAGITKPSNQVMDTLFSFDVSQRPFPQSWTQETNLNKKRFQHAVSTYKDNQIFVFCGVSSLGTSEVYDVNHNNWTYIEGKKSFFQVLTN